MHLNLSWNHDYEADDPSFVIRSAIGDILLGIAISCASIKQIEIASLSIIEGQIWHVEVTSDGERYLSANSRITTSTIEISATADYPAVEEYRKMPELYDLD